MHTKQKSNVSPNSRPLIELIGASIACQMIVFPILIVINIGFTVNWQQDTMCCGSDVPLPSYSCPLFFSLTSPGFFHRLRAIGWVGVTVHFWNDWLRWNFIFLICWLFEDNFTNGFLQYLMFAFHYMENQDKNLFLRITNEDKKSFWGFYTFFVLCSYNSSTSC